MVKVQVITYVKEKECYLSEHTNVFSYLNVDDALATYIDRGADIVSKSNYCCVLTHDQEQYFDVIIVSQLGSKKEALD